jgi:hypothetical protein
MPSSPACAQRQSPCVAWQPAWPEFAGRAGSTDGPRVNAVALIWSQGSGRVGAQTGEPRGRRLTLVVRHEAVDRPEVDCGYHVDRVKGSQRGLRQGASRQQQGAVDRPQPERIDEFTGTAQEDRQRQPGIVRDRSPDCARDLGQHELGRDEVGVLDEGPEQAALRLVSDQLHKGRRVRVEQRHASELAADLVEGSTQRVGVTVHLERLGQPVPDRTRHSPGSNQSIECRAGAGRWAEFGDWSVAVSDQQSLTLCHAPQVAGQVLPQLGDADGPAHVHEGSTSPRPRGRALGGGSYASPVETNDGLRAQPERVSRRVGGANRTEDSGPELRAVMALQRLAGNAAVQHLLARPRSAARTPPSVDLRQRYRLAVQRAVATWGGSWDTNRYAALAAPRAPGVDIQLRFRPGKHVNATKIGLTQALRPTVGGAASPVDATAAGRAIPAGKPNAGWYLDQLSNTNSPIYAATPGSTSRSLGGTPIVGGAGGGKHAFRFTDGTGKLRRQTGELNDAPARPGAGANSSQVFETTALAIEGEQAGAYYGSVQWGWENDAAGNFKVLPLKMVSWGGASGAFTGAAARWNRSKTAGGKRNVALPGLTRRFAAADPTRSVDDPNAGEAAPGVDLPKNTPLQIVSQGDREPFNAGATKWRKTVATGGRQAGQVGWVLETDLSVRRIR